MAASDNTRKLINTLQSLSKEMDMLGDVRAISLYGALFDRLVWIQSSEYRENDGPHLPHPPRTEPEVSQASTDVLQQSVQSPEWYSEIDTEGNWIRTGGRLWHLKTDEASILSLLNNHVKTVMEQISKRSRWQEPYSTTSDLFRTQVLVTSSPNGYSDYDLFTELALERKPADKVVWPSRSFRWGDAPQAFQDDLWKLRFTPDEFSLLTVANDLISKLLKMSSQSQQANVGEKDLHNSSVPMPKSGVAVEICRCGHRVQQHVETNGGCRLCNCQRFIPSPEQPSTST